MTVHPYSVQVEDAVLDEINRRVRAFPWHEMPADGGWNYGANLDYMRELCDYWVRDYDWRRHEAHLNTFENYVANVDGIDLHFIHHRAPRSDGAKPLLLSHGWPGSVRSFCIIAPLTAPEAYGGGPVTRLTW